jgi:hypothetical protein
MGKGFVRVCHSVNVVSFLNRIAAIVHRIEQFPTKAIFHRFLAAFAGIGHNPSESPKVLRRSLVTSSGTW